MAHKCDKCGRKATLHVTDIEDGQKIERHLCEECAASENVTIKALPPISQILEELVLQSAAGGELGELKCELCGINFLEFRQQGVLGCPNDYAAFENVLLPLLDRAHEGGSFHTGKVPANAAEDERRQTELLRLRSQLKDAVAHEKYERAAELRDRIKDLEGS
jgi:protein arginine kinase activator